MKGISDEEFAGSTVARAWEPPEEVVVTRELAHAAGLQPEDYGVLIRLLLRDPGQPSGILALATEFQASGWKMGASRLRTVMTRLQKAGHVRHERDGYDETTGRPKWRFSVYRNPANNRPLAQSAQTKAQVSPTVRNPTRRASAAVSDASESNIYAAQADSAVSNTSAADSAVSDASESNIYAAQADSAVSNTFLPSPPHPPEGEEVNTSSPNPLTQRATRRRLAKPTATTLETTTELLASEFLQGLPGQWQCGPKTAGRLAKLLADTATAQGWTLGDALAAQLTGGKQAFESLQGTLRSRIEDLPRFRSAAVPGQARGMTSAPPVDVCERCSHTDPRPGWVYSKHPITGADITVRCTHEPVAP